MPTVNTGVIFDTRVHGPYAVTMVWTVLSAVTVSRHISNFRTEDVLGLSAVTWTRVVRPVTTARKHGLCVPGLRAFQWANEQRVLPLSPFKMGLKTQSDRFSYQIWRTVCDNLETVRNRM